MRIYCAIGLLGALLFGLPAAATTKGPAPPPPDTIDCALDRNKTTCIECGGGGILACCFDDDCKVVNKPQKVFVPPPWSPAPPTAPLPTNPGWELL